MEAKNILSETQAGFRQNRQTLDQIIALENSIKAAKTNKKIVGAVFLDLEKAYDTMWREGLLKKLKELGISGNMYNYINDFLKDRTFQVKVGSSLSTVHQQINGTPQGAVISPTLFNISVNDLNKVIDDPNTKISQFADDCAIWKTWKKIKRKPNKKQIKVEQLFTGQLEKQTRNIINHLKALGLKVNTKKTQTILFNTNQERTLKIGDSQIKTSPTVKFLGITFDKSGKYKEHIQDLYNRANKNLNLLKMIANKRLHAPYSTKRAIYRGIVEASMTYGQEVYIQAYKSTLQKLDKIQAAALRLLSGGSRNCSISAMQVATNIEPLDIRRKTALLKYQARCILNKDNRTRELFRDPLSQTSRSRLAKTNKSNHSAAWTAFHLANDLELNMDSLIAPDTPSPPWTQEDIEVDTSLSKIIKKKETLPMDMKATTLAYLENKYKENEEVYTDGSKKDATVGIGIYSSILGIEEYHRITDNCSITTAELMAIKTTLQTIDDWEIEDRNVIILTDSLSASQMIKTPSNSHSRNDIVNKIFELSKQIRTTHNTSVKICWVPAHCGIIGNEKADAAAKLGLEQDVVEPVGLGKTEMYALISQKMRQEWQRQWDSSEHGLRFRSLVPKIGKNKIIFNSKNRLINRLRLDCPIFKTTKEACHNCNTPTSTDHILLECPAYSNERQKLTDALDKYNIRNTREGILNLDCPQAVQSAARSLLQQIKEKI